LAKKKAEKPKREFTKRQLSRWQQQKRRQRIIFGSGILIIVAVLSVVGAGVYFGWYVPERQPLQETVIEVNETEFNMDYYLKMLKYEKMQLESYGVSVLIEQMSYLADGAVEAIQHSELIRQEAAKLGISVSDEEVDEKFNSLDPPPSKEYRDVVRDTIRAQLLRDKLLNEYFEQQVPQTAEQRHIMAMFLESASQANKVIDRLERGELFSEVAGELSLDSVCKEKKGDLGWHPRGILPMLINSSVLEESAFSQEVGVISAPIPEDSKTKMVGYWLIEVEFVDEEEKIAQVNVILLGSEQEANEVRARLEAGEDFATLAKEFSQHADSKDKGGELEVHQGDMSSAFDDFAFSAEIGVLSQPIADDTVSTEGGYWLVKVTEIDNNRQIANEDRDILKADALNKWVEGLFDDPENKVVSNLDDAKKLWAIMHAVGG
jgi:parvulin-like peptidyl-prolyl isomerase